MRRLRTKKYYRNEQQCATLYIWAVESTIREQFILSNHSTHLVVVIFND